MFSMSKYWKILDCATESNDSDDFTDFQILSRFSNLDQISVCGDLEFSSKIAIGQPSSIVHTTLLLDFETKPASVVSANEIIRDTIWRKRVVYQITFAARTYPGLLYEPELKIRSSLIAWGYFFLFLQLGVWTFMISSTFSHDTSTATGIVKIQIQW